MENTLCGLVLGKIRGKVKIRSRNSSTQLYQCIQSNEYILYIVDSQCKEHFHLFMPILTICKNLHSIGIPCQVYPTCTKAARSEYWGQEARRKCLRKILSLHSDRNGPG